MWNVLDRTVVQERAIGGTTGSAHICDKSPAYQSVDAILSIWPRYLSLRFRMAKIRSKSGDLAVSLNTAGYSVEASAVEPI